jgi:hypothetical protein
MINIKLNKLLNNDIKITPEWNADKKLYIQVNRAGTIIKGKKVFNNHKAMVEGWKTAIEYEYDKLTL